MVGPDFTSSTCISVPEGESVCMRGPEKIMPCIKGHWHTVETQIRRRRTRRQIRVHTVCIEYKNLSYVW